jgi:putative glutamine amidotransferase
MTTIGITLHPNTSPDREELDQLVSQIAAGVVAAGGEPLLIAAELEEAPLYAQFASLDGLILSGGGDVDPARYGERPTLHLGGVDEQRDRTELLLAGWALAERKPLLGICRGLQLLNVACGGALYQDVSQHDGAMQHAYYPNYPHDYLAHGIILEPDSLLAALLGKTTVQVNSLHHQACRSMAPALRVVARAADGIVEAAEIVEHPFALAVQWHPEALLQTEESRALFGALVAASAPERQG